MCFISESTHKGKNMLARVCVCVCVIAKRIYTDEVHVKYYSFCLSQLTGCLFLPSVAVFLSV